MRNKPKSNILDMNPLQWMHYQVHWMGRDIVYAEEHPLQGDILKLLSKLVAPTYRSVCPCLQGKLSKRERNRICEGCTDCSECEQFKNDMKLKMYDTLRPLFVETIGVGEEDIDILVYGKD